MTEQIYINDVLMDTEAGKRASLVFQSPYFTDIDSIVSNRTTAVDLPRTPNNLQAVKFSESESAETTFAYNRHRVVYLRDGVRIFTGLATLQGVTPSALRFSFTWGNSEAFRRLLDAKLRDLQEPTDYIEYDVTAAVTDTDYYLPGWNDFANWGVSAASVQPCMPVPDIVKRIEDRFGVRLELRDPKHPNTEPFERYVVPLVYRNADDESRALQGVEMGGAGTYEVPGERSGIPCTMTYMAGPTRDINHLVAGGTLIDVTDIERLRVYVPAGFQITYTPTGADVGLRVISTDENGLIFGNLLRRVGMAFAGIAPGGRQVLEVREAVDFELNVEKYSYVALLLFSQNGVPGHDHPTATPCEITRPVPIELYDADRADLTFGKGAIFPLYRNLPDWSVSDLLKNLMKIEGLYAYSSGPDTITLVTIGDLYSARSRAVDWSDRVMTTGGAPTEQATTLNSYARRNWFRWAEDDTVAGDFDGYIDIEDQTLDAETDLVTVDFAPTEGHVIPVWKRTEDDTGGFEWQEVEPRILRRPTSTDGSPGQEVSFDGMDWPTLIESNYKSYRNMIRRPRVVKTTVQVNSYELAALDLAVPVFVRQWGRYYAVSKLTAKTDGTAETELIQLGRARTWTAPSVPPAVDSGMEAEIFAVQINDGTWRIHLASGDRDKEDEYNNDPDVHLVLMRYGFTRPGKLRFKEDRIFGTVGTHTDRDKHFRGYRGGKRYRIIGHDILKGGKLAGATASVPQYKQATLVFKFGDPVVLPPAPIDDKYRTNRGRLRNTARRGVGELFVALVRKGGDQSHNALGLFTYGCELISNVLQVRGYTSDHRGIWVFKRPE